MYETHLKSRNSCLSKPYIIACLHKHAAVLSPPNFAEKKVKLLHQILQYVDDSLDLELGFFFSVLPCYGPLAKDVDSLVILMRALLVPYMFELDPKVPPLIFDEQVT